MKFNGITFESVGAPFGTTSVSEKMTGTSEGSVWMATSTQLYQYQPGSNMWNEWNLTDLYPASSVSVHDMETVNGELWMKTRARDAESNLFNVLIHFDSGFSSYTALETPGLTGLDYAPIIPGSSDSGDSAYFSCEVGCMEYNSGSWTHRVMDMDSHKSCGEIQCLTTDTLGRLWAGTYYGFSLYDGSQWTNFYSTTGNQLILDIMLIDVDTQNQVYGYCSPLGGILRLSDGNTELISFPYSLGFSPQYDDKMAVDTQGRIWLGRKDLYYYDGEWHQYEGVRYVKCMIKDFNGGVWLGSRTSPNDTAGTEFHLVHIKNDLTFDDYTASNSSLIPWEKDRLYLDQNGILWIKHMVDYYSDKRNLQSFDGSTWIDYSNFTGFPALGAQDFVKDNNDRLHIVDPDGGLYALQNNEFVLEMEQSYYSHSLIWWQDRLRCVGYIGDNGGGGGEIPTMAAGLTALTSYNNLLTLSSAVGMVEKEVWSRNYDVNVGSGLSFTVDVVSGMSFAQGGYLFKTRLLSSNGQSLCQDNYPFSVRETGISVSISGDSLTGQYVKQETDLELTLESFNNTGETRDNLTLIIKQISPSGTETEFPGESFGLSPGETKSHSIMFNESETGIWTIHSEIREGSAVLSQVEVLVEITAPLVSAQVLCPGFAGDDPFDITVKLANEGKIDVSVECMIPETATHETLSLTPGEEKIIQASDTISTTKTYTVTLSGDIDKTESKTVQYGYVENFNMNILPAYREGNVSIGYQLANAGGLPFVSNLNAGLYIVGAAEPLLSVNRSYHLYPGAAPVEDVFQCEVAPGNYILKYQTSKSGAGEFIFTVMPSGIGTITLSTPGNYPVGLNDIGYKISNKDSAAGNIGILITVKKGEQVIFLQTRDYYLQPGEEMTDALTLEFASKGNYQLIITGPKLSSAINTIINVLDLKSIESLLTIEPPKENIIPASVSITNQGIDSVTGSIVLEVEGRVKEEPVSVPSGGQFNGTFGIGTGALSPGSKEVKIYLKDETGEVLAQNTGTVILTGADIQVIEVPQNLEISAGSFSYVPLKLKNQGHLWGEAVLKVTALESLNQEREISLEAGEEIDINEIFVDVPADLPTGNYPFYYTLSGTGVENSTSAGNFNIKVNGTSLEVEASLDRSLYNPGEIAVLTINITSTTSTDAALEAVVNWGGFNETRAFNLNSGSTSLVFNIPLDEEREEKVFYGIYHPEGKGIHLNDVYLNFYGDISVETDKQVYAPGEVLHAVFTGEQTGVLAVQAFEETYTLNISGSASASFQVPVDTLGGTYGISWNFIPTDPLQPGRSGSHPFDVSGLVVKVAKSQLEKGKYIPGETINAQYVFESNRDITLGLRCWTTTPTEEWEYLGESSVTVSATQHVNALTSYAFTTTEAGTHHLVYGLYQEDQLVLSGSLAFDVGDAVLLGISPDKTEYKNGDEPVRLKIDYFGEGFAQLQVLLDEENVHQQGITINGLGSIEVVLESSVISGGSHTVKAVLSQNSLTSTKNSGFIYGTNLPDLTTSFVNTVQDGLNYSFTLEVTNNGKTASTTTSMVFSDNNIEMETASIPALEPGESHEVTFNWNGSGKAGSHELAFAADNTNTIKEYSETNNSLAFTLEVPALFYSLETDPPDKLSYPANTPIIIVTRLINNQESPILLTLDLSITNEESGVTIHNRIKEEQIPGFGSKVITDTFNTGVYPAGNYTLSQSIMLPPAARGALFCQRWQVQVTGANLNRSPMPWGPLDPPQKLLIGDGSNSFNMVREIFLFFEPTKIITGSLQVQPQQIPAKTPTEVQLTLTLKNAGNVPLEDEILQIDVFNKDLGEVVISEEFSISIPLAEEITETKTMSLNLVEGNYEIWIKHNEEILSLADLAAISAVKPSQTIGIYPRVLIMNLHLLGMHHNQVQFLTGLLQSQGIEYEVGFRLLDSYVKLNKGQANVNIVLGNEMGRNLRDELKEKVWHGEGLILFYDKPAQNPQWTDFLGVVIKPIHGKNRETVIQILPNEFCSEGEIECPGKLKLKLIKEKQDVVLIAQTKQKKYPVITYRKYGKGHILILNKSFCRGSRGAVFSKRAPLAAGGISELLINAIARFSQDIYTGSDLTRILPLELSLKNESSEAKTLKIKTFLPYGVEAFDFQPEPEEGEELKWTITIPEVSTEEISYWLKLPDQVNSYEIKTELYDEETKLDEVSILFDVSQVVLYRINELLLELEIIDVVGKDARLIRKAAHHLEKIRNRSGNSFIEHLLNLHDSVKAAAYLGEVKSVDVSAQRLNIEDIMVIMGRRFYEAVKTWGEVQLNSILKLL